MTTFTVTSSTDDVNSADDATVFTLREAIAAAEANGTGADEVVFDAAVSGQTIRLTSGVLEITSGTVSINGDTNGDGNPDIIISGDKTGDGRTFDDTRILNISAGVAASLSSLHLSGGMQVGLVTYGDITYDGGNAVGAIYNAGTLTVSDSTFSLNYAKGGFGNFPTSYAHGGRGGDAAAGIFNSGTLTVSDTLFYSNESISGNGGGGADEHALAGHFNGGNAGNAGTIFNTGSTTTNYVGFLGNILSGGQGGFGGDNTTGHAGGNGGNGGLIAVGVLNEGTLSGSITDRFSSVVDGAQGRGGTGTPAGSDGMHGVTGFASLNVAGGSITGFQDLYAEPLAGAGPDADTIVGGNATGIITSFSGDDDIRGGINVNTIHAGAGKDIIRGGSNVDTIFAGSGNDLIIVENSDFFDNVNGGTGVDTLDHSAANTYSGNDVFDFNTGTMTFNSTGQAATAASNIEIFKDNNNSNNITTSAIGMTIFANGGNDLVTGLGGDDTIDGGLDNDTLIGGGNTAAGDTLSFASFIAVSGTLGITVNLDINVQQNTGAGLDTILGFENLTGSAFDDTLSGSYGNAVNNIINGMGGNDTLVMIDGAYSADHFNGGANTDTLLADVNWNSYVTFDMSLGTTSLNTNLLNTFEQIENITFGGGARAIGNGFDNVITVTQSQAAYTNTIDGGGGDDTIEGGQSGDILMGGLQGLFGDTVSYSLSAAGVTVNLATQTASLGDAAGDTLSGFENATGSAQADTLTGSSGGNTLMGGAGNDTLLGGAAGDTLDGGDGTGDTVSYAGSTSVNINLFTHSAAGGHATGDFIINVENVTGSSQSDVIAGDGNANVLSGALGTGDMITFANSNAFVNVNLTTNAVSGGFAQGDTISGFERVIGSAFDDFLAGTVFANQIAGGGGNDTIFGDAGADNLTGGNGFDTLDHTASAGGVTINLLTGASSGGNAQGDIIGTFERVNGSAGGVDVLTGNAAVNILRGNGGNDFIEGGAGGDTLDGGAGSADTLVYTSSNAAVVVNIGLNTASGGHAQLDIISGFERLTGSSFGDTLTGTTGSNILKGGLGNDSLTGGAGSDTFVFDTAIGATNIDAITDFSVPQDTIQLDNLIFTALTDGALNATQFGFAATADTTDRIIYNQATGQLFYDTNGSTAGGATQIATLATGLAMTAADFFVI